VLRSYLVLSWPRTNTDGAGRPVCCQTGYIKEKIVIHCLSTNPTGINKSTKRKVDVFSLFRLSRIFRSFARSSTTLSHFLPCKKCKFSHAICERNNTFVVYGFLLIVQQGFINFQRVKSAKFPTFHPNKKSLILEH
jgi:hypothetical protein